MATAFITGKIAIDGPAGLNNAKLSVHVVAKSKGATVRGRRDCGKRPERM